MAKLNLQSADARQREQDAKDRQAWLRVHGPGPAIQGCDECGSFAPYARGDFGRPDDEVERFCPTHAPDRLKRPGDFLAPRS